MQQDFVMAGDRLVVRWPDYAAGEWLGCCRDGEYMRHTMRLDGVLVKILFSKAAQAYVPRNLNMHDRILFSLKKCVHRDYTFFLQTIERISDE